MEQRIEGTPLIVTTPNEGESEWTVTTPSLEELKRLLGMPLLVEFCRCSVAGDRLTSLGDFGFFNEEWKPRQEIVHARNLQTMFWFTCGTLHEAIDSLATMERLGIEGLLASFEARKPWVELRAAAKRWNEDPIYQRVRDKIAFHIDASAIRKGINKPGRDAEPVVWKQGHSRKERSTFSKFAQDCLISVLFPPDVPEESSRKEFGHFAERIRNVHLEFTGWIQELFMATLRGASLGLTLTPTPRPTASVELSPERLEQIGELVAEIPDSPAKDALDDLIGEVTRLRSVVNRGMRDPSVIQGQRRRGDEEQRLRAVAAVAKELLTTAAPSAESRLRDLLGIDARMQPNLEAASTDAEQGA